jgi:hypothetical protein
MGVLEEYRLEALHRLPVDSHLIEGGTEILKRMYHHHRPTANHVYRVMYGVREACRFLEIPWKWPLLAAVHHDAGKLLLSPQLLGVTKATEAELDELWTHSMLGYGYTKEFYRAIPAVDLRKVEIMAQIVVRWHRHQVNPYPAIVPPPDQPLSAEEQHDIDIIDKVGSFVDCIDALTRRRNSFTRRLSLDDIDGLLTEVEHHQPELLPLAERVIPAGVFPAFAARDYHDFYRALRAA